MSERAFLSLFFNDKSITNPINKTEIFFCSELYKDYRKCKALYKKGLKTKQFCRELRYLGQKCYLYDEEDFERYLVKLFEEKRKYINFLKEEGSILYQFYKSDPSVFSLKSIDQDEDAEGDFNEYLINQKNDNSF
jgi:hypothetical protein